MRSSLWELFLDDNQISNIGPLVDNLGIDTDDVVRIEDNSLDCEAPETLGHIDTLIERGVFLWHDC